MEDFWTTAWRNQTVLQRYVFRNNRNEILALNIEYSSWRWWCWGTHRALYWWPSTTLRRRRSCSTTMGTGVNSPSRTTPGSWCNRLGASSLLPQSFALACSISLQLRACAIWAKADVSIFLEYRVLDHYAQHHQTCETLSVSSVSSPLWSILLTIWICKISKVLLFRIKYFLVW